jgi:hypothetical protein
MTIKTRAELEADFASGQFRGVTAEKIRNLIDSLGVGGVLYGTGEQAITTAAAPITAYIGSNANGVVADEELGTLTVPDGGDGFYQVVCVVSMTIPATGQIELRLRKNGNNTPFRTGAVNVVADEPFQLVLLGSGNLVAGDEVAVYIQGSGSVTATVDSVQFQIDR